LGEAITLAQAVGGAVVLLGLPLPGRDDTQAADLVAEAAMSVCAKSIRTSWPDLGRPHSEQTIGRR
jgi:hypothetical protein